MSDYPYYQTGPNWVITYTTTTTTTPITGTYSAQTSEPADTLGDDSPDTVKSWDGCIWKPKE